MANVEEVRSEVEILKSTILKRRESKAKSKMTPGSSPLNLYAAEILSLRGEGFGLDEIAHALYLHHQIKIGKAGLSAFIIRYTKRMSKLTGSEVATTKPSISKLSAPVPINSRDNTSGNGSEDVSKRVSNSLVDRDIVQEGNEEFLSTQTRELHAKKDRQLLNAIAVDIDSMTELARSVFKRKHGNPPEFYEKDIAFWKALEKS